MIYSKFSGYQAGRRLYFGGGGGGGGGGDGGIGGDPGEGPADADSMAADVSSDGAAPASSPGDGVGGPSEGYNPYNPGAADNSSGPYISSSYTPQNLPSINADIYRPTYADYATGVQNLVGSYGQNMQSPFGAFVNPFSQGGSQGIAGLYNQPEYPDYGIAGLTR